MLRDWIDHADFSGCGLEAKGKGWNGNGVGCQRSCSRASPLFASKIRPILAARCYQCHGAQVQQNGLRLDSLAGILKGSESGKIVVEGHADQSRLIRRLQAEERPQMPYGGPPLSRDEIASIRAWIDQGAPGPDSTAPVADIEACKALGICKAGALRASRSQGRGLGSKSD